MSNIFFTSDSHFHHKSILNFENRPFETIEEMNAEMVSAWNKVVTKNSTVYHLGDFSFGGYNDWIDILNQLRGNIVLIKGNHCKTKIINRILRDGYLQDIHMVGHYMKAGKYTLNLTHYPLEIGNRVRNFNLSGHIHSHPSRMLNQINLGVDSQIPLVKSRPFGEPVPLDDLISYLDHINPLVEEQFLIERGGR